MTKVQIIYTIPDGDICNPEGRSACCPHLQGRRGGLNCALFDQRLMDASSFLGGITKCTQCKEAEVKGDKA